MKIFQLTDFHIAPEGVPTYGIDVRANFLAGLREMEKWSPDALVITGDLCFEVGEESVYQWILEKLNKISTPWFVIPGNHDDSKKMAQVFDYQSFTSFFEGCFTAKINQQTAIFLNSETGFFTENQLVWFEKKLAEQTHEQVIVFVHYPPIRCGVRFIDANYPMQESSRRQFQRIVFKQSKPVHVFCGHYHAARTIGIQNLTVHVTPSTFYQIDPRPADFQIDHYRPAFRWISVENDRVQSSVHYFQGHLSPELSA
jgi:3',5'-cyclic-AMP phosphodiesterase